MKRALLFALAVLIAPHVRAQCTLGITKDDVSRGGTIYVLKWSPVPGATHYIVEETRTNPSGQITRVSYNVGSTPAPQLRVEKRATESIVATYRVIAVGMGELCAGEIQVRFGMDEALARITRRSILPLVGSTPGQNGALFKTSLRLRNDNSLPLSGRLILHPLGKPGSDADPSIRYSVPAGGMVEWEDIVAEFGIVGLGSLDIVPDRFPRTETYRVPLAEARLYNVANGGTFGTIEAQTQAIDFLQYAPNPIRGMTAVVPGAALRLNVGVRSVEAANIAVRVTRGGQLHHMRLFTMARDQLLFASASDFAGVPLEPGDQVHIHVHGGSAIPMYSLTDNTTNDPALYYPPTRTLLDLSYFELP